MKNILLVIVLIAISLSLHSQSAVIAPSLNQKLETLNATDFVKVNIVFTEQVHHGLLNAGFKAKNTPVNERAKIVIRKSMQLADNSQKPIIKILDNKSNKVESYDRFWIINMMTIHATKSLIEELSNLDEIDYIEEYDNFKSKPIEVKKGITSNSKSVGGNEPGLTAINAPALWAMGYTGKARRYYSIDTGVWPSHPSISDNWLGNYQPLTQAWHAVDSPYPVDKGNSHGTHTAGTVLGLDPITSDTIGVAFNAYLMASDPIVTNLADIKPLPEYIHVFEFALNPDGDTTTTDDIPDAINNSWGISGNSQDTTICSGYVTQMFDAIEAAGIANVFSAGNSGPADTTIGQPQYVSTGLVNTFTVGAINGANPSFPITNFSSHGPTACPLTGSLKIKPEVVAPGLNVRSAVDQNNYASYNGTSMAGPHVVGAVLLLKEAFPNVSGETILLAIYNTAIDLGVAGEDNTYGKGMIDVLAAYNDLSLTFTPTPPNQFKYDATVSEILSPSVDFKCTQTVSPKIIIENKGDSTITNAQITYQLNNETASNYNWIGTLIPGDTASILLPNITALSYGDYELKIKIVIDTNNKECDYINNQRVIRFNLREDITTLPYSEDFENMRIDSSEWLINNPDFLTTWDTTATQGLTNSTYSATMKMADYTGTDQIDDLLSAQISLPAQDSLFLRFDIAYQMLVFVIADTMTISISTDCGNSYSEIYKKGGANLETNDTVTSNWTPQYPSHWRTEYVDITPYANNDVIIKFETYNRSGNNLYLDNIWVYEGAEPSTVGIEENKLDQLSIYPNPTEDNITVDLGKNKIENTTIEVLNILGKSIYKRNATQQQNNINLNEFSNGIYFVKIANSNEVVTHKIVKR
ncbi:MAG: hypothetical protein COB15_17065 [Flavobacteriales bacterium]|nr:MAG: hypothetical protein COB15_17065 [Flavobacteriales bacterium]